MSEIVLTEATGEQWIRIVHDHATEFQRLDADGNLALQAMMPVDCDLVIEDGQVMFRTQDWLMNVFGQRVPRFTSPEDPDSRGKLEFETDGTVYWGGVHRPEYVVFGSNGFLQSVPNGKPPYRTPHDIAFKVLGNVAAGLVVTTESFQTELFLFNVRRGFYQPRELVGKVVSQHVEFRLRRLDGGDIVLDVDGETHPT